MYWPFHDFCLALQTQPAGEPPIYVVFPHKDMHASWMELFLYLGTEFRPDWMKSDDAAIHREFHACGGHAETFYHESQRYLYHLNSYWLEGWKRCAYGLLFDVLTYDEGQTVLDYGCGIGADGLWLLDAHVRMSFADYDNPCSRYLRWRLAHRTDTGSSQFFDIEKDTIPHHDIVFCMDVVEHLPPAEHIPFLEKLGRLGRVVILNLVHDMTADGTVHHAVDVDGLTAYLETHGEVAQKDMYVKADGSKVRFLAYRLEES